MNSSLFWLVFTSGLLSSTLLPGNSEIVFSGALLERPDLALNLLLIVTLGNTIGGIISWVMGRVAAIRFPLNVPDKPSQQKAIKAIQRWGSPVLLLSWLPFVGDPLCLAAGWLKIPPLSSFIYIGLGKLMRYSLLMSAFTIW